MDFLKRFCELVKHGLHCVVAFLLYVFRVKDCFNILQRFSGLASGLIVDNTQPGFLSADEHFIEPVYASACFYLLLGPVHVDEQGPLHIEFMPDNTQWSRTPVYSQ